MWESMFDQITRMRSVSVTRYGICKLVVKKYHGTNIQCSNGEWIRSGDWVGEIHLDNKQVLEMSRSIGSDRAAIRTARMLRTAIQQISDAMENRPELANVSALTGITLLHRGIIRGLGFELHPLPSKLFTFISTYYLRCLLRMLHPEGKQRVSQNTEKLVPMMLMMTKQSLLEKHGKVGVPC